MSNLSRLLALTGALLFSLCTASAASAAYADPPGRVARLDDTQGEVSYSPAGQEEWISAVRNRPLISGDRLWTNNDARAEFQIGSAAIRLGSSTSAEILDLNDHVAQIQMTQGTLNVSVRRMYPGQIVEVDTPTLAFTINRAGRYRVDVDPHNNVTAIVVWEGEGEAYGENAHFPLSTGDAVKFYDPDLRDYEMSALPRENDFDRYSLERDQRLNHSEALRYIGDDVVGYADLDEHGSWRPVSSYGNVWFPSQVEANWAPYQDGNWVWQEPWGWTWVDNAPWGFAPSHYGRWVNVSDRWGWIPGPRNASPIYSPALVAFVGDRGWSMSISSGGGSPIGWFPLGPNEVYVPSYQASRDYFTRVNVNNTLVNNTTITNVYNSYSSGAINVTQVNYANRTVAGAVTVIPKNVFVNAQPVRPAAMRLGRNAVTTGEITRVAPIAPSEHSVIGASAAGVRPSPETFNREVFARNAPPPDSRSFAEREQQLQTNPGQVPVTGAGNSVQNRNDKTTQRVRVIVEQSAAVNARTAGSRRGGDKSAPRADAPPVKLPPPDSSAQIGNASAPVAVDLRSNERNGQDNAQQQAERQRKVDSDKKAADQVQIERQRQAATQQQAQRQSKADSDKKAAEQVQIERRRQAAAQQQAQRQNKADSDKKAADQVQIERRRQAAAQQQAQRQSKADSDKKAADQVQIERQRQAATQQQAQRQRKADSDKKAAEQQQMERQRQAKPQQQVQPPGQPAGGQQAAPTPQQRQAECERRAKQLNQDAGPCRSEIPQENAGTPNADKKGK